MSAPWERTDRNEVINKGASYINPNFITSRGNAFFVRMFVRGVEVEVFEIVEHEFDWHLKAHKIDHDRPKDTQLQEVFEKIRAAFLQEAVDMLRVGLTEDEFYLNCGDQPFAPYAEE